jgi:hypothetical protein
VAELWWKKIRRLEQELEQAKQAALNYQKDWKKMLDLVKAMDSALEREQELVKRLTKSLIQKKKGK